MRKVISYNTLKLRIYKLFIIISDVQSYNCEVNHRLFVIGLSMPIIIILCLEQFRAYEDLLSAY